MKRLEQWLLKTLLTLKHYEHGRIVMNMQGKIHIIPASGKLTKVDEL